MATYAIIKTGGKQYRVEKDQIVDVELIEGEPGVEVAFDDVLLVFDGSTIKLGQPVVADSKVKGELIGSVRGPKIDSMKYKRRKQQRTHWGHRQNYSRVKITEIVA